MPHRENEIIALVTYVHNRVRFRDPPFSFLDFCAVFPEYELLPAEMPRGYFGEILVKGPNKIVRYRSACKPATNRFTIGHEIGHGFLHENEQFKCKASPTFSIFKPPAKQAHEWEADYFSAELLMPIPMLNRYACDFTGLDKEEAKKECSRLAGLFGVAGSAMRSRLEDLTKMREWEGEYL